MKSTILLLFFTCCLIVSSVKAQNLENKQNPANKLLIEEYLKQSEQQKKSGVTLMTIGGGAAGLGLFITGTSSFASPAFNGGIYLMLAGAVTTIIGVPIIISSASKGLKAAQLSFGANSASVIKSTGSSLKICPAMNISLPINSSKR